MSITYGVTPQGFVPKTTDVILSEIVADQLATIDPELDTSAEEPIGQLNGIMANRFGELWAQLQILANANNRDAAEGFLLDNIGAQTGSLRLAVKPSFVFCNVTLAAANSPYLAGTLTANVAGQPSVQFSNAFDIEISADGTYSELFTSVEDGPIVALAGTLTAITTPVTGWSAITNPHDAALGNLEEEDPEYRLRQEQELAAAGSGTDDSIRADLLQVAGVKSVQVIDNQTLVTDPVTGTPGKSFQCVVFDGLVPTALDADIGQVIWDDKPAGIQPYGTTTVQVVDSQGNPQVVGFSRPVPVEVWLAYTVTFATGTSSGAQTAAISTLKSLAVSLSQGFDGEGNPLPSDTPGILLPGTELFALVFRSLALKVAGVIDVPSMALDFSPSPTNLVNLTCTPTQILVLDTSRITVNGV